MQAPWLILTQYNYQWLPVEEFSFRTTDTCCTRRAVISCVVWCLSQTYLSNVKFWASRFTGLVMCLFVKVITFFHCLFFFFSFVLHSTEHYTHGYSAYNLTNFCTSAHLYLKCCGWRLDAILQSYFCITHALRTVPLSETKVNRGFQAPSLQCMVSMLFIAHCLFSAPLSTAAAVRFDLGLCFEHYLLDPVSVAWENETIYVFNLRSILRSYSTSTVLVTHACISISVKNCTIWVQLFIHWSLAIIINFPET